MAKNYHIASTMGALGDLQKGNLWVVTFGNDTGITGLDGLTVRAQTAKIPGRSLPVLTSKFMGMTANYAGTENMDNKTLEINFDEHDDQKVYKLLNDWFNLMFDSVDDSMGHGEYSSKLGVGKYGRYSTNITLGMTDLASDPLEKAIVFHNAFITNIGDGSLSYDSSSKVTFSATFQYDWFEIKNANSGDIDVPKAD